MFRLTDLTDNFDNMLYWLMVNTAFNVYMFLLHPLSYLFGRLAASIM